jgi:hypothetical protein
VTVDGLLEILGDPDRWSLQRFTLFHTNGILWWILGVSGLLSTVFLKGFRRLSLFFVCVWVGEGTLAYVFNRMREYDGFSRFLIPLMVPGAYFVMVGLESLSRASARLGVVASGLVVLGFVGSTGPYFERLEACPPLDLALYSQANGNDHHLIPDALIREHLPERETVLYLPCPGGNLFHMTANVVPPEKLIDVAKAAQRRFLVVPSSGYYLERLRWWVMPLQWGWVSREFVSDPRSLTRDARVVFKRSLPFGHMEFLVFEIVG